MAYYPSGPVKIYFNREYIGETIRTEKTFFTGNTDTEILQNDSIAGNIGIIKKGEVAREVKAGFSLPISRETLEKFPVGEHIQGRLEMVSIDEYTRTILFDAYISVSHNIDYKKNTLSSVSIEATALVDEYGNDYVFLQGPLEELRIQDFTQLGYTIGGALADQLYLEEDTVYIANDGIDYLNIGGNRDWVEGNGTPDDEFTEATFKFLNKCPYPVGAIFETVSTDNPTIFWKGTTWEAIPDDVYILNDHTIEPGIIGGSNILTNSNLPVTLPTRTFTGAALASHTHTTSSNGLHDHTTHAKGSTGDSVNSYIATNINTAYSGGGASKFGGKNSPDTTMRTSDDGAHTHTVNSASAGTPSGTISNNNPGGGQEFKPKYFTVRKWIRLS